MVVIWNVISHRLMLARNGLVTRGDAVETMHVGVDLVGGSHVGNRRGKYQGKEI